MFLKWKLILIGLLVCNPVLAFSKQDVLKEAKMQKLGESTQWLALLHFPKNCSKCSSELEPSPFFLSTNGFKNPQEELERSLELWLAGDSLFDNFPARRMFFESKLTSKKAFVQKENSEYNKWRERLGAGEIRAVYASAFLGNPASSMGHLFLKIDRVTGQSSLRDYVLNYGANTPEGDWLYPIKGVLGGYDGQYSLLPYSLSLLTYLHNEQRDVWEFPLQLTPVQKELFLAHLWELRLAKADYFFFDENCAEKILRALEVVLHQPRNASLGAVVFPLEVLRTLAKAGLLKEDQGVFKPARQKEIASRYEILSEEEKEFAKGALGGGEMNYEVLDELARTRVLDYLLEEVENRIRKENNEDYQQLFQGLLQERLKIKTKSESLQIKVGDSPLKSVPEGQAAMGMSSSTLLGRIAVLRQLRYWSDAGKIKGQEIVFGDFIGSMRDRGPALEEVEILRLFDLSIAKGEAFDFAWKLRSGWRRQNSQLQLEGALGVVGQAGGFVAHSLLGLRLGALRKTEFSPLLNLGICRAINAITLGVETQVLFENANPFNRSFEGEYWGQWALAQHLWAEVRVHQFDRGFRSAFFLGTFF